MIEAPAHFWDSLADFIDKVPTLFLLWCCVEVACAIVLRDRSPDAAREMKR